MTINIDKITGRILDLDEITGSEGTSGLGFTPLNPSNNLSELTNKTTALNTINGVSKIGLSKGSMFVGTTVNAFNIVSPPSVSDNVKYYLQELNGVASFDTISGGGSDILEAAHIVGAVGEPAFQNNWINYGGDFQPAIFYKESNGLTHIEGCIKSGTNGSVVFTLPDGYRPLNEILLNSYSGVHSFVVDQIDITPDGNVSVSSSDDGAISLNIPPFRTT